MQEGKHKVTKVVSLVKSGGKPTKVPKVPFNIFSIIILPSPGLHLCLDITGHITSKSHLYL